MTMTVRYYRYVEKLERQLPDSMLNAFGRYLVEYCFENNIPVSSEPVADRRWGKENRYPVSVIQERLPLWLARQNSQEDFTIDDAYDA
jgi:leucyl-tRNA synthetase